MRMRIQNLGDDPFSTDVPNAFGGHIRVLVGVGETVDILNIDPFYINQNKLLRDLVTDNKLNVTFTADPDDLVSLSPGDEFVKVTAADTTPGRLDTKIAAGTNVSLAILNPGANEELEISATDLNTDEFVRVTGADTTPGRLNTKLTPGANIGLAVLSPGANESVEISGTADEFVRVTGADTTPGRLDTKVTAGANISLAVLNPGANEELEISGTASGATALGQLTDVDAGVATALGNLLAGDGTSEYDDLVAGADLTQLIADSGETLGLRYRVADLRMINFDVENPVTGDDIPRFKFDRAFTVLRIVALKIGGGTSFDWELRYSSDANDQGAGTLLESDTGVSNVTTGVIYLPPFDPGDPATIPALNWLWLELPVVPTGFSRPTAAKLIVYGFEVG